MKAFITKYLVPTLAIATLAVSATGCSRSSGEFWEDSKTCSRYMGRGMKSLVGKNGDSRQIHSYDEFSVAANYEEQFIPLEDTLPTAGFGVSAPEVVPQAKVSPGDPGGAIPGIKSFTDPSTRPDFAAIFKNINFPYNSSVVKGDKNTKQLDAVARYLKAHPNTYVFVEGHCDERGPQAYNLALGTRRANAIRTYLVKQGVKLDNVFTISYGKERPIVDGNNEASYSVNRRGQFKIYQR